MELAGVPSSLVMIQVLLKIEACGTRELLAKTFKTTWKHHTRLQSTRGLVDRASLGPPTHCGPYPGDEFLYTWTTQVVGHGAGTMDHKARQGGQGLVLRLG